MANEGFAPYDFSRDVMSLQFAHRDRAVSPESVVAFGSAPACSSSVTMFELQF